MAIKKSLVNNDTLIILISSREYNKVSLKVVKELAKSKVCYVTLNKTYQSIKEYFEKNKISARNFSYIDAISSTIRITKKEEDHCRFVSSPSALTELSLEISRSLKLNVDYIIFDSITNLLIHNDKKTVEKFVSLLLTKIKQSNTKGILFALDIKEYKAFIKKMSVFADTVIDLQKT